MSLGLALAVNVRDGVYVELGDREADGLLDAEGDTADVGVYVEDAVKVGVRVTVTDADGVKEGVNVADGV